MIENLSYDIFDKAVRKYITDEKELEIIKKAYLFAKEVHDGDKRRSGEDYILHPLYTAYILTKIHSDYETLASALLHEVMKEKDVSKDVLIAEFGDTIASLVEGITKINKISFSIDSEYQINYYKKILVGLCEDVRVIIIKLAERLHNMYTLWAIPREKQKEKAKETLEILAPIAHRLGIHYLKSELEDYSLKYYKPEVYDDIVTRLNNTKMERDSSIIKMENEISDLLTSHDISHEIKGRSKSIYSIYNKMQNGKKFEEIYDILALRVYVNTESECYLTLGLIHSKYKPLSNRFKDYIAMPKENMYQSLHTTIFGVGGKLYEVQIRTYDMDKIAEYGIASHWAYKEKIKEEDAIKNVLEEKLKMFRNIIEDNKDEALSDEDFVNNVKKEALNNIIYVYTPKGDVIELPLGATPIDFAYKVHTTIGDTLTGAMVNDSIVPLDYKLKDGDIVKINVNKNSKGPSKEWINIAFTSQARNRIKNFYSKTLREDNIKLGRELVEKELRKNKIPFSSFESKINLILDELSEEKIDDVYLGIGNGKYSALPVINILNKEIKSKDEMLISKIGNITVKENNKNDVIVSGIDEIKVTLANCCKPIKGDEIIGYITKGSGIVVHRCNCHNITDLDERIIPITWNDNKDSKYKCDLIVRSEKKDNILTNIISKASSSNITIQSINLINNIDYQTYNLLILVENIEKLKKFMNDLDILEDIIEVKRI